ncbi:MAG: DUF1295 domain-containing protein [Myxococcota bacterium]|nr:DUF1295 domain-containing protein [Myxococcota bacterium]
MDTPREIAPTMIRRDSKAQSIFISLTAYVGAAGVGVVAFVYAPADWSPFWRVALGDLIATLFIFICSLSLRNSSMYDPYWSVKPGVFAVVFPIVLSRYTLNGYDWLMLGGMMAYALRLTTNFYRDWPGLRHEDWRYRALQERTGPFYWLVCLGGIHLFPTMQVFLGCLPAYVVMSEAQPPAQPMLMAFGAAVLWASVILAYVADEQMRTFRRTPGNQGRIMDRGLWKRSRHPNYLGECLTWVGLWLMALGQSLDFWWTGAGAVAIITMFYGVSIPWMDERSTQKRPDFAAYMQRTGRLWPKL